MIRTIQHISKYQTKNKTDKLDQLFEDYRIDLEFYISLIIDGTLPLKIFLSSKLLPNNRISHGQWKQVIFKQASEIIRSCIRKAEDKRYSQYKKVYRKLIKNDKCKWFTSKKLKELKLKPIFFTKYFPDIDLKNISINVDARLFDSLIQSSGEFNEFINLRLPYRDPKGKHRKSLTIKLPIKYHKHSLKFSKWKRLNTIKLLKINDKYYLNFFYEKEEPIKKKTGDVIGIDQGYKNLITCSSKKVIGDKISNLYQKISRKKQGSKSFKRSLIERNNYINQCINSDLNILNLKELIIEDLKKVKHKSKFSKKVNNKLQRWVYSKVVCKLEFICQENGVLLTKVNPAYTSQRCSCCGYVNKENRKASQFKCLQCGIKIDADYNAAINISRMGVYNPHNQQNQKFYYFL